MIISFRALAIATIIIAIGSALTIDTVFAHGSITTPPSRVYNCRQENPENPKSAACRAAVGVSGVQGLYDWNGVNQLPAGNHQAFVPDGQLCSGGKSSHAGLDLPRTDWVATPIAPDVNGKYEFVYRATAPHSTEYHKFYITKDGYDPTQPLKWSDLDAQPFCDLGEVPLTNGEYRMSCDFPFNKSGKHVVYHIWQRNDSAEAFYACVDVSFGGGNPTPIQWKSIGNVRAQQDLTPNSTVTFRLFDASGADIESHTVTLQAGMNGKNVWPFHLANEVNTMSAIAKIGVLDSTGNITPSQSDMNNVVYIRPNTTYTFAVDKTMAPSGDGNPDGGNDNGGGDNNTGNDDGGTGTGGNSNTNATTTNAIGGSSALTPIVTLLLSLLAAVRARRTTLRN